MKKLILAFLIAFTAVTVQAQHTTSRIPSTGCTGGQLLYSWKTVATGTATTERITNNAFVTVVHDTLNSNKTDSIVTANAYVGDQLTIVYVNRATADTVTFGALFGGAAGGYPPSGALSSLTSNRIPIPASKVATITFIFNGYIWQELCHAINL